MELKLTLILCIVHATQGSLLEETVGDAYGLLTRWRKHASTNTETTSSCQVSDFSVMQDVDFSKLSGEWFEAFRTGSNLMFRSGVWKLQATKEYGVLDFLFSARMASKECLDPIQGKMSMSSESPSTIIVSYRGLKANIEEKFIVIDTDYKSAVLYGCRQENANGQCEPDAAVLIILTRFRSMSPNVLDHLKKKSKSACIDPSSLIQQDTLDACNLNILDPHRWQDSLSDLSCKTVSPCTLACPPCCQEGNDGCIRCQCETETNEENRPEANSDVKPEFSKSIDETKENECIYSLSECSGKNCQLKESRPGCFACNCDIVLKSPAAPEAPAKIVFGVDDIRSCPTTCRTRKEDGKIICDCSNTEKCSGLPAGGPNACSDKTERYYFDDRTGTCHAFYGSCLPEVNNFFTLKECINTCAGICELPLDPGMCKNGQSENQQRFYFNRNRGVCDQFLYGGCGGNANNFESMQLCKHQCPEWMDDDRRKVLNEICGQRAKKGDCHESQIRYFYLPVTRTCTSFFYSGCGKNDNNFETEDACKAACINGAKTEPKACPDIENCPCPVTQKDDRCYECPCEDDDGNYGSSTYRCSYSALSLILFSWFVARWSS